VSCAFDESCIEDNTKHNQKEIAKKIKEAMENPLQLSKVVEYLEE